MEQTRLFYDHTEIWNIEPYAKSLANKALRTN